MRLPPFTHDFLLLFAGPMVWAVHFLSIYSLSGIACARAASAGRWLGWGWEVWTIVALGAAAAAVLGACLFVRPRAGTEDNRRFVRWTATALAALALYGVALETFAALMVPTCSSGR